MNEIEQLKEAEKTIDLAYDDLAVDKGEAAVSAPAPTRAPARRKPDGSVTGGLILIAVGGIFLLTNLFDFSVNNWWALFILIPAFSNFGQALRQYRRHGRVSRSVRGSLTGGLILSLVAAAFLFNLDWGLIWPVFLIVGGLSALIGGWFE